MASAKPYAGRFATFALAACLTASPLAGQQDRLDLPAIGQIADVLIDSLLSPSTRLSRVEVAKRGVYFGYLTTIATFGHDTSGVALSALQMRNTVRSRPDSILADCGWSGDRARDTTPFKPCQRLGWGVSFAFQQLSATSAEVVVRAWLNWPDRGPERYVEGVPPGNRASLTGYATDVAFSRSPQGHWIFKERRRTMAF